MPSLDDVVSRGDGSAASVTEFQVVFNLVPGEPADDADLQTIADLALEALGSEAVGLALGPVVCVDLDQRSIEVELTVEATSASEVHQKMSLILGALERAGRLVVEDSSASRSPASAPEPAYA